MPNIGDATLPIKYLNSKHPDYCCDKMDAAAAYYYGGQRFEDLKEKMVYKRMLDQDDDYKKSRFQVADYDNHIAPIFDLIIGTAFQAPPKIVFSLADDSVEKLVAKVMEESAALEESEREAYENSKIAQINKLHDEREAAVQKLAYYNSLNEGLTEILSERLLDMILYGYGLLTASYPDVTSTPKTYPQQLSDGDLDSYICYISPMDVIDWSFDDMGCLNYVKTHVVAPSRSTPYGPVDEELHTWTYYMPGNKIIYTAVKKKESPDSLPKIMVDWEARSAQFLSQTSYDGFPIFECSLADRLCLMGRVEKNVKSLYNLEISLDFSLHGSCYPQAIAYTDKRPGELSGEKSQYSMWVLNPDDDFEFAVPAAAAYEPLGERIECKIRNLYVAVNAECVTMGQRDQHAAGPGAKQMDRLPIESMICYYVDKLRCGLCRTLDYIIELRHDTGVVNYKVEGMNVYSPVALQNKIAQSAMLLGMPLPDTAKKLIMKSLAQDVIPNASAAERAQIANEQETINYSPTQVFPLPQAGAELQHPDDVNAQDDDDDDDDTSTGTSTTGSTKGVTVASSAAAVSQGQATSAQAGIAAQGDIKIKAPIKNIDPQEILSQHGVDPEFRKELSADMKKNGYDPDYPILSVETVHGYIILDGTHRGNSAKDLKIKKIPSYVIPYEEYRQLLDAKFAGVRPKNLSQLDPYIFVKVPGSKGVVNYSKVRQPNDHDNGGSVTDQFYHQLFTQAATSNDGSSSGSSGAF